MSASMLTFQVFGMLIPVLASLYVSGKQAAVEESMGRVLKYVTIAAFFAILAAYVAGPTVIDRLLGQRYSAVAANLRVLVLGLPATGLIALGATRGVLLQCPGKTMITNGLALGTFIVAAFLLVPRMVSVGASIAVTLAMFAGAALTCYIFDLASVLRIARFGHLVLVSAISFAVLILLPAPVLISGIFAAALFIGLLFGTGALQIAEVRAFVHGLTAARPRNLPQAKSIAAPGDEAPLL
jgi:O-antigen/teichoic acid export membrane protein